MRLTSLHPHFALESTHPLHPHLALGQCAHYTDRDKIMRIVDPVIVQPLLAEWHTAKREISGILEKAESATAPGVGTRHRRRARQLFVAFLEHLRGFTVLDPACGSGNFLYLALLALKDLEHRVTLEGEAMGFQREFPTIDPSNVKGIEINRYAAELARVSVWIGQTQWMLRNGFGTSKPILSPLENIECRDAILSPDGERAQWPEADVVIGNPPFLGDRVMRGGLGHEYTKRLRETYVGSVPASADLVCYWFAKAGEFVAGGRTARVGLVATNSIRGGNNRPVLDRIVANSTIFNAWSDEPWVIDGAAVRVSLVCFASQDADLPVFLNGEETDQVHADLTKDSFDLTQATKLASNLSTAFLGVNKNGAFDVPGDVAREWLRLPANPQRATKRRCIEAQDCRQGFSSAFL